MIKNPLNKITKDGCRYRLKFFDDKQIIFKNSNATGDEASFSETIKEFSEEKKAIECWDTIQ